MIRIKAYMNLIINIKVMFSFAVLHVGNPLTVHCRCNMQYFLVLFFVKKLNKHSALIEYPAY